MRAVLATVLILVFLIRIPKAVASPKGRASWLACGFGGLGFLVADSFVPYTTVDSWLGGANYTHLLRNLLLTTSLWFLRQAVMQTIPARHNTSVAWKFSPITLLCGLTAMGLPFIFADTNVTSGSFTTERGVQFGVAVYVFNYMMFVALISLDMVWALRGKWIGHLGLIRVGALLILAASVDELIYVAAVYTETGSDAFRHFIHSAFMIIYLGAALIAVSLCVMAFHPLQRTTTAVLTLLARYHQRKLPKFESASGAKCPSLLTPRARMYRSLIALHDLESQHKVMYGRFSLLVVGLARYQLSKKVAQ